MDTFAISWTSSIQSPKSCLFWKIRPGIIRFDYVIEINSDKIRSRDGEFAISFSDLEASAQNSGDYCLFVCSGCGDAGCAGLLPVRVTHTEESVLWEDWTYLQASYKFDKAVYQKAIENFAQEYVRLTQKYPDYIFAKEFL